MDLHSDREVQFHSSQGVSLKAHSAPPGTKRNEPKKPSERTMSAGGGELFLCSTRWNYLPHFPGHNFIFTKPCQEESVPFRSPIQISFYEAEVEGRGREIRHFLAWRVVGAIRNSRNSNGPLWREPGVNGSGYGWRLDWIERLNLSTTPRA